MMPITRDGPASIDTSLPMESGLPRSASVSVARPATTAREPVTETTRPRAVFRAGEENASCCRASDVTDTSNLQISARQTQLTVVASAPLDESHDLGSGAAKAADQI